MIEKQVIGEWVDELSSKAPVPGGGGASALGGALGAALGQMVANLTVGKKKYAEVQEEIMRGRESFLSWRIGMLRCLRLWPRHISFPQRQRSRGMRRIR